MDAQDIKAALDKEQEDQARQSEAKRWKPTEAGEELIGTLVEGEWVTTQYGDTRVLTVEDDEGALHTVWVSGVVFQNEIDRLHPAPGSIIGIRFTGKHESKKPGGNAYNGWAVFAAESNPDHWRESFQRMQDKKRSGVNPNDPSQRPFVSPVTGDALEAPY